jgi:hypothetical protein
MGVLFNYMAVIWSIELYEKLDVVWFVDLKFSSLIMKYPVKMEWVEIIKFARKKKKGLPSILLQS